MPRANAHEDQSQTKDDYVFFWKINQPHGWASQWYHSPFTSRIHIQLKDGVLIHDSNPEEELTFPTAEHWMMGCKALLFKDFTTFNQIIRTDSTTQDDLKRVKHLGRQVSNFNDKIWNQAKEHIVLEGNLLKFRQNEELRGYLMETGEKILVEASPMDRVWGIGFGERGALSKGNRRRWGLNLLGKILEDTRRILREEEEAKKTQEDVSVEASENYVMRTC